MAHGILVGLPVLKVDTENAFENDGAPDLYQQSPAGSTQRHVDSTHARQRPGGAMPAGYKAANASHRRNKEFNVHSVADFLTAVDEEEVSPVGGRSRRGDPSFSYRQGSDYGNGLARYEQGFAHLDLSIPTEGKLMNFMPLDLFKLEGKLLEEQRRLMEEEQQQMMAEWAAPGRRSVLASMGSPRGALLQQLPLSAQPSMASFHNHSLPHVYASSSSPDFGTYHQHSHHHPQQHQQHHHYEQQQQQHHQQHQHQHEESPGESEGQGRSEGEGYESEPNGPEPARPDVIKSKSRRLVELMQERKAELAPPGGKAGSSSAAAGASGAEDLESLLSPGKAMRQRYSTWNLRGQALRDTALAAIRKAERTLEKVQNNEPLDSRPGTSDFVRNSDGSQFSLQDPDMGKFGGGILKRHPHGGGGGHVVDATRKLKRKASLWAKSAPEGGMLKSMQSMSRAQSRRAGGTLPRSLALSFVTELSNVDDYSLVSGVKRRMLLMEHLNRLSQQRQERFKQQDQTMIRQGTRIASQLLASIQEEKSAASLKAGGNRSTTSKSGNKSEDGAGSVARRSLGGSSIARMSMGGPPQPESSAVSAADSQIGAAAAADEEAEELTEQEAIYGKGVFGMVDNLVIPMVPPTPDGTNFSGAYGRLRSLRKKLQKEAEALISHNPVAFQEEAAEQAEAEYRAMAERARLRFRAANQAITEPRLVEDFMKSVKYLQSERPFFLPPIMDKEHVARPHVQVVRKVEPEWTVEGSMFEGRRKECEAHDFMDSMKIKMMQFTCDWGRIAVKARFRKLIARSDEGVKGAEQSLETEIGEVREVMSSYKDHLRSIFAYYGCCSSRMTSEDIMTINMTTWLQFCQESGIMDNSLRGCSNTDLQNVFVSVNFEEDHGQTAESNANDDDAMMRFEFYEGIVRAAFGKLIETGTMDDASDACRSLMEDVVLKNVPREALINPNEFRERLYCKEMEAAIGEHWPLLQAMYKLYKAKDRTKYFWVEHWGALLDACKLTGPHTGLEKREAKLIFCWSQMLVSDELKRRKRAVALMMFDFIEALARVSDMISMPSEDDCDKFLQYEQNIDPKSIPSLALKQIEFYRLLGRDAAKRRRKSAGLLAPRTRPLAEKFSTLMSYMLVYMRENWGGRDVGDCVRKMNRMATMISGGIELG